MVRAAPTKNASGCRCSGSGPDAHGIVGESPLLWNLRAELPFIARQNGHVLILGASGTGKEPVSCALHALSSRAATTDPELGRRFFTEGDATSGEPRIDPMLMDLLMRRDYTHNVRELESFLWRSMTGSRRHHLALTRGLGAALSPVSEQHRDPATLEPGEILATLERHDGNQTRAAEELGLKSRHVLYRLLKKHGITVSDRENR